MTTKSTFPALAAPMSLARVHGSPHVDELASPKIVASANSGFYRLFSGGCRRRTFALLEARGGARRLNFDPSIRGRKDGNRIHRKVLHAVVGLGLLFATPLFAQSVVVDAGGKTVGNVLDEDHVERNINGVWLAIGVNPGGFTINSSVALFFTTVDCSGAKYLRAGLPSAGYAVSNPPTYTQHALLFPGAPVSSVSIHSWRQFNQSGPSSPCYNGAFTGPMGVVQNVNLDSLALVPPFTVK